jgi:molybdate transport system substrate-binding protein
MKRVCVALMTVGVLAVDARAEEITFLCAPALQPAIDLLLPEFERATRHKANVAYASIGINASRIRDGHPADLAIVSPQQWQALRGEGKLGSDERRTIGKVGIGAFVKKGQPRLDIGGVEALKRALVQSKSIAIGDQKTPVGAYMLPLIERLGLKEAIQPKLLLRPPGNPSPTMQAVVNGDAELGFSQMSEILASSEVDAIGPLPAEVQNFTSFTAAIPAQARQLSIAGELIEFLRTPAAVAVFRSKGIETD